MKAARHAARDRPQARWFPAFAVLVIAAALYGIVHSLSAHAPPPSSAAQSTHASTSERTSGAPRASLTTFAPSAVAARALRGRVETERGAPLGGARVCVTDPHASCCNALSCTSSDARGHFVLRDTGSSSTLLASHPGYLPLTRALAQQESGAALVLKLRAGGARVAGQVLDGTGGPIGGAWIKAGAGDAELAVGVSDDAGYFELFLPAGSSPMWVSAEGYSEVRRQVWAPSDALWVLLVPAASLSGHVVARGSGEPVGGVAVRALNTTGMRASPALALSAADGSFELSSLVAGEYALSAANERWRSDEQAVSLDLGGEQRALVIEVAPAVTLTADVSVAGAACAEGWISANGPVSVSSAISSAGPALLEGLSPGLYSLEVRCPPGAPASEELQVGSEPLSRGWDLAPGASVRGVVRTGSGEPVAGAEVSVAPVGATSERSSARCTTDGAGEFTCSGLLPGEHDCWSSRSYPTPDRVARVNVTATEGAWVTLRAEHAGSVLARVSAGASDVAALSLVARREGSPQVVAQPDREGFLFPELELGEYELAFEPAAAPLARVLLSRAGERVEVQLPAPPLASISGTVLDERGAPVLDAWVRAQPSHAEATLPGAITPALTNDEGAFVLADLVLGTYDLEIHAPSGRQMLYGVEAGGSDVTITLPTRATLHVRVTDSEGRAVERFTLSYGETGSPRGELDEGRNGVWSSSAVTPGSLSLQVSSEQGVAARDVHLPPGGDVEVTLRVTPSLHTASAAEPALD